MRRRVLLLSTVVLCAALAPGDVTAARPSPINRGLVTALNCVGKSLFGRKAWAARTRVIAGRSWVVMDLSVNTAIPTLYDVFIPPDPCIVVGIDGWPTASRASR